MDTIELTVGIDPGWASFGLAVIDKQGNLRTKFSAVPRDFGTPYEFIEYMNDKMYQISTPGPKPFHLKVTDVFIERFVTYGGVQTDPENILMMIGALQYAFEHSKVNVHMVRAIDWKPKVCKYLVRTKGFNNPFPSFDKKYSVLAAQELSGFECDVNHEADAICLAYLKRIDDYNAAKSKK